MLLKWCWLKLFSKENSKIKTWGKIQGQCKLKERLSVNISIRLNRIEVPKEDTGQVQLLRSAGLCWAPPHLMVLALSFTSAGHYPISEYHLESHLRVCEYHTLTWQFWGWNPFWLLRPGRYVLGMLVLNEDETEDSPWKKYKAHFCARNNILNG